MISAGAHVGPVQSLRRNDPRDLRGAIGGRDRRRDRERRLVYR